MMNDPFLNIFLSGMITAVFLAAVLFFARFWSRCRDLLFLAFTVAFWLLALNEALIALVPETTPGEQIWFFLLRVAAFLLIATAIVHKNAGEADENG
jgi:hypothetical protein